MAVLRECFEKSYLAEIQLSHRNQYPFANFYQCSSFRRKKIEAGLCLHPSRALRQMLSWMQVQLR